MKQYLEIGKIVSVHGLKGEVKVQSWCDTPAYMCSFKTFYSKDGSMQYKAERCRAQGNMVILKLEGVNTPEQAQLWRNKVLYMNRQDAKLPEGSYFIQDLIGLRVYDEHEKYYGAITNVLETGANDVYELKSEDGRLYYIPAIPSVVLQTDVDGGKMIIFPMEGLFDEN